MKYTIFYFITIAILFTSCHKEATLPPITNTGANVIACKVDGKVLIISGNANSAMTPFGVFYNPKTNYGLIVISGNNENPRCSIWLNFIYADTPGKYPIVTHYPQGATYDNYINGSVPTGSSEFLTDSLHSGYIHVNQCYFKQISGTFAFDAINDEGKVVHITEGRFDVTSY